MNAFARRLPIEDFDGMPVAVRAPDERDEGESETLPPPVIEVAPAGCGCPRCAEGGLPLCRGEAYDVGWAEGHEAGSAAEAGRIAGLEAALRSALEGADKAAAAIAEANAEALGRMVVGMLEAALPGALARLGTREARLVAEAVMPGLRTEPEVAVRASPEAVAMMQGLASDPDGPRVVLEADPSAGPGDVRVAWRGGRLARKGEETLARMQAVLAEFGVLPAETSAHG